VRQRLRNEIAGATYHVVARGVDRRRIFVDDEDYETYTGFLGTVVRRQGWNLLCYCLMPNHVHLLIETPETNLANGMQWLHARYALAFNRRHERKGHLFEAPYKSPMVECEEDFVRAVGYIVVNPVAAVLCKRSREWPWGSDAAVTANGRIPRWLAHELLLEKLEAMTGLDCYADLVASCEREHARRPY
jgi:REP-associated tyrosine transposase